MLIRLLGCALLLGIGRPAVLAGQTAHDHVTMGTAALQAHDLRTGVAHYEAALATDSTDYEANWRAAMALLDLGQQIPDSVPSAERDSLYARAERLARRAVATDSTGADGQGIGGAADQLGPAGRLRERRPAGVLPADLQPTAHGLDAEQRVHAAQATTGPGSGRRRSFPSRIPPRRRGP